MSQQSETKSRLTARAADVRAKRMRSFSAAIPVATDHRQVDFSMHQFPKRQEKIEIYENNYKIS